MLLWCTPALGQRFDNYWGDQHIAEVLRSLPPGKRKVLDWAVHTLTSPCRRTHSLKVSFGQDRGCRIAPVALSWVIEQVKAGYLELDLREGYQARFLCPPEAVAIEGALSHGPADAPVTLIEFIDYECPTCREVQARVQRLLAAHGKAVRWVLLNFPLSLKHPNAERAATAVVAAQRQGRGMDLATWLLRTPPPLTEAVILDGARRLGLQGERFARDRQDALAQVRGEQQEGERLGVQGTPTFFINGCRLSSPGREARSAAVIDQLKERLEDELLRRTP